ncbi:FG-GAP-like repeat-containing protein [Streptomyces sp. NBC_00316]|uniref:FG-GAP-like repeat-containing protein n=1 Tax=Streptomyces sp. NBC_00316 TaxID=2975710 RepID=UPI002E281580|nr:FG-GAP-like repeat-containing protein [Streptomyces sp. NBC_00316]
MAAPPAQAAQVATAADSSQEVVIPPADRATPRVDTPLAVGSTGFLHQQEGRDGYTWTDFASGTSTQVPGLQTLPANALVRPVGAGGDLLAISPSPAWGARWYSVLDPHTGERRDVQLPGASYTFRGTVAGKVLALESATSTTSSDGVLLDPGADPAQPLHITGLPAGAQLNSLSLQQQAADGRGAVISFRQDGVYRYGLLDPTTAVITPLPEAMSGEGLNILLSADRIAWWGHGYAGLRWLPRGDFSSGAQEFPLPDDAYPLVLLGDTLLTSAPDTTSGTTLGRRLTARPLDGAEPSTVLDHLALVSDSPPQAADGSALFVGGTGSGDWAVHRFTARPDETPAHEVAQPLPPVTAKLLGLSLYRGTLDRVDSTEGKISIHQQDIGTGPVPVAGAAEPLPVGMPSSTVRCATGEDCVRIVEGNGYGASFLSETGGRTYLETRVDPHTSHVQMPLPGSGGEVRDASPSYVVVDGGSPKTQYLIFPGYDKVIRSRPVQAAALWYSTLWSATPASPGTLTAERLTSDATTPGKPVRTVRTGAACVPTELQATARWLYWSCGADQQAGVYDLANNRGFAVPSGPAMLGDGYVIRHDRAAGELKLTDFHTGSPLAERSFAVLPAGTLADDRRITWTVDKYSGHVAYVDADRRVHVSADGVPDSAPVMGEEYTSGSVAPRTTSSYYSTWTASFQLSRPVDSWEVDIAQKATGRRVATLRGGAVRGRDAVGASWNGRESNGALPPSGTYTWQLTARVGGGTVPVRVGSGTLQVMCGALPTHVYDCDGFPDMVAVRKDGQTDSWEGHPQGHFYNRSYTADWPTSSTLVPVGDINGDGYADMLVRNSAGELRAYWGFGQVYFARDTNKSTAIGKGWQQYDVLTSPGDLNGDGRADLVARQTATGDMYFYAGAAGGKFAARVRIFANWKTYGQITGVGDITGDGRPDLLGHDRDGGLWRYNGLGNGTFAPRVKVFSDWGRTYNSVVGIGDLSGDGKNDIVVRDSAGKLFRNDGNGKGSFGARTQIGSGWGVYKALY